MNGQDRYAELADLIEAVERGEFEFMLLTGEGGRPNLHIQGECICRPHFDIRALHEISKDNRIDERV